MRKTTIPAAKNDAKRFYQPQNYVHPWIKTRTHKKKKKKGAPTDIGSSRAAHLDGDRNKARRARDTTRADFHGAAARGGNYTGRMDLWKISCCGRAAAERPAVVKVIRRAITRLCILADESALYIFAARAKWPRAVWRVFYFNDFREAFFCSLDAHLVESCKLMYSERLFINEVLWLWISRMLYLKSDPCNKE